MSGSVETYARALFDLARESGSVEATSESLATVAAAVRGAIDLREALLDTGVPAEKKRDILRDIFGEHITPEALAIVTLVVERGMTDALGELARAFEGIVERELGVVVADVTTAVPLTDELRAGLVSKLSSALGRTVTLRERVDASILGGIVIKVAGRVIDGSIAHQLREVREALASARQGGEAVSG